jgi:L-lactate dehydrogenase complex protein LldF
VKPFAERYVDALADENIATGLLSFQRSWRESRDGRIAEVETITGTPFAELRAELAAAKRRVRADWEAHVAEFARTAGRAGANVVRVADAAEANAYVAELCRRRGVEVVVKGKSMVSEEIGLNAYLEARGVTPVETDLGEWLLQLAGEHPSHLVMPAIHKRKAQAAILPRCGARICQHGKSNASPRAAR